LSIWTLNEAKKYTDQQISSLESATKWHNGSGAPSSETGANGDYYLNTSNGDVYTKVSGSWVLEGNIKGATGPAGETGETGAAGATGATGAAGADGADGVGVPSGGTTGQVPAKKSATDYDIEWVDPSGGVGIGTSSTAAATAAKTVTLTSFTLETGATVLVTFTNGNTTAVPTLNVNSTGALSIYHEDGNAASATYPAYFPTGAQIEFTYNGTGWVFKKRVVTSYVNGTSWYKVWSDGWIEQGGLGNALTTSHTVTFLKTHKDTNFTCLLAAEGLGDTGGGTSNAPVLIAKTVTTITISQASSSSRKSYWETKGF